MHCPDDRDENLKMARYKFAATAYCLLTILTPGTLHPETWILYQQKSPFTGAFLYNVILSFNSLPSLLKRRFFFWISLLATDTLY